MDVIRDVYVTLSHVFVGDSLVLVDGWDPRSLPPNALCHVEEEGIAVVAIACLSQGQDDLGAVEFAVDDGGAVSREVNGHIQDLFVLFGELWEEGQSNIRLLRNFSS